MPTFTFILSMERELEKQIYQALKGPVVEAILKTSKNLNEEISFR